MVLAGLAVMTLLPVVVVGGMMLVWAVLALLLAWGGIEALAALERWFENDPRFQR